MIDNFPDLVESTRPLKPVDDGWGMDELLDLDPYELGDVDNVAAIRALHQAEAMLQAKRLELMNVYATASPSDIENEFAADVIAAETQTSLGRTQGDLTLVQRLADDLPQTWAHFRNGRLDRARVWQVVDAAALLDAEGCAEFESRIYPAALDKAPRQLRRWLTRTVLSVDPDAAAQRATVARTDRRVSAEPGHDGMGWLHAYLPAGDLQAIWQCVDTTARHIGDDDRTMDQRRADALRDLILGPNNERVSTVVYVTVTAETLLGLADLPGDLHGFGPLPAAQIRHLGWQLHATWSGMLVDDDGNPRTLADRRYRFTGRLAEFIRLRDGACVHPACTKPARRCDIDHRVPYPRGSTSAGNGDTLCRRHHRMKHETTWITTRRSANTTIWTHPAGIRHSNTPDPVPIAAGR